MKLMKRLIKRLTADRKKLSVMVVLLALGMLLWGRLLLKDVPRTAVADEPGKSGSADVGKGDHTASRAKRAPVNVTLASSLPRDVFACDESFFQKRVVVVPVKNVAVAKSVPAVADVSPEEALKKAGLKLQSTMMGNPPRAMISGQLLAPGETIKDFIVREVRQRSVVLEYRGLTLELEM